MSNVETLHVLTTLPIPVERVLSAALDRHGKQPFARMTVIGVFDDGEEYFASSTCDCGAILWDMARFKHQLMKNADNG